MATPSRFESERRHRTAPCAAILHSLQRLYSQDSETVRQHLAGCRREQQASLAKQLGADHAFAPEDPALNDAILDATQGLGADLTVETVGGWRPDPITQAIELTREQGRFVVIGGYRTPITVDWLPPMLKEQTIIFSSSW